MDSTSSAGSPSEDGTDAFLAVQRYAVAGASQDRQKYGHRVFVALRASGREVYPVNPNADRIEGVRAYPDLASLPERPEAVSIVTPPPVTRRVVSEAIELGVSHLWMQPGAEDQRAIAEAREAGLNVIADGPCVLVKLKLG